MRESHSLSQSGSTRNCDWEGGRNGRSGAEEGNLIQISDRGRHLTPPGDKGLLFPREERGRKLSLFKKTPLSLSLPFLSSGSRRRRVDPHKKQLICIEAKEEEEGIISQRQQQHVVDFFEP